MPKKTLKECLDDLETTKDKDQSEELARKAAYTELFNTLGIAKQCKSSQLIA